MAQKQGRRVAWDARARLWPGGGFVLGGAPWGVVRLGERAQPFARTLCSAGAVGLVPGDAVEQATADLLVARGVAHPVAVTTSPNTSLNDVTVIVPVKDRAELLDRCLAGIAGGDQSVAGADVVVVDDGSADPDAIRSVAQRYDARVLRHGQNHGPAAARNTGLDHLELGDTAAPLIAFLDSDCKVEPGWLDHLLPHFADPRVAAVAPRVRPRHDHESVLTRYEDVRSALDMGNRPELVQPGARLGFVPSAAVVMRREAIPPGGFEPSMRWGEDVDLVWRLADDGWLVRYEPAVEVRHETRTTYRDWARQRYQYGTSAIDLDRRHPGRLAPAHVSAWNVAAAGFALSGRPVLTAVTTGGAVATLARRLRRAGVPTKAASTVMAGAVVGKGLAADAGAVGHALRREWWPAGWAALARVRRSRPAAAAATVMLAPVALEYVRTRPRIDPARYLLLRLAEDAVYGSGVLTNALRHRGVRPLLPDIRLPATGRRPSSGQGRSPR